MDWKIALKIGGPSTVVTYVFYELLTRYINTSEVFKTNLSLNILVVVVIFSFCLVMGWLILRRTKNSECKTSIVENNTVVNNEIRADMNIGADGSEIKNNKIEKNKVDGDLNIG